MLTDGTMKKSKKIKTRMGRRSHPRFLFSGTPALFHDGPRQGFGFFFPVQDVQLFGGFEISCVMSLRPICMRFFPASITHGLSDQFLISRTESTSFFV